MNLNALDARDIRQGMKRGIGFAECLTKYNCTANDLAYHIRRLFIGDGDSIIKQMQRISEKNEADSIRRGKKAQKQSRKLAEQAAKNAQVATEGVENTSNPPQWKFPLPRPTRLPSCMPRSNPLAILSSGWSLSISD